MISRRIDLFLSALLPTARGAIAAADDDSDDGVGARIWRNSHFAESLAVTTDALPAVPLPVLGRAAVARDPTADAGDLGEGVVAGAAARGSGRPTRAIADGAGEATTVVVASARGRPSALEQRTSDGNGARQASMPNESAGASKAESRESTTKTTVAKPEDGTDDNQLEAEAVRRGNLATQKTATPETSIAANNKRKEDACLKTPSGGVRVTKKARGVRNDKEELDESLETPNKCVAVCNGPAAIKEKRPKRKRGARTKCSHDDCPNNAQQGGVCRKHGAKRKTCSREGCTTNAQQGGVCFKHGGVHKTCTHDGCTNHSQKGGVCFKHGGRSKTCSRDGCTTYAQQGGVCFKHGARVNRCSSDGCANYAQQGGVCTKHGARVTTCSRDGCTNNAKKGGVCKKHRAKLETHTPRS